MAHFLAKSLSCLFSLNSVQEGIGACLHNSSCYGDARIEGSRRIVALICGDEHAPIHVVHVLSSLFTAFTPIAVTGSQR